MENLINNDRAYMYLGADAEVELNAWEIERAKEKEDQTGDGRDIAEILEKWRLHTEQSTNGE